MDIAVVVQRQIASTRAGVMFTIDPSTGRADRIVIEGSFGLGESVVSGSVSPDRYVVDKQTMAIVTREMRAKELVIEPDDGWRDGRRQLSAEESMRPVLDDAEVRRLADLAVRIERHYGAPQDTEWAFDADGHVWMLQSRPVTSAGGERSRDRAGARDRRSSGRAAHPRPWRCARQRQRTGACHHLTRRRRPSERRRRARDAHDLAGLGAADAASRRDRDRLWRHDLSCGDRVPRARRAVRRRDQPRRREAARRRARDGRCHPRCHPPRGGAQPRRGRCHPVAPLFRAAVAPVTGTKLLVNLSEPSQVERAAALEVDGVGLLRAEMMVHRGARRHAPAAADRAGPLGRVRPADGRRAHDVRGRVRTAPRDLPDDRLPHERIPRPARAANGSSPRRPTR